MCRCILVFLLQLRDMSVMKRTLFFVLSMIIISGFAMATQQKIIYGYVEKATLIDKNLTISAKLDTGAKSSSLSAIHIEEINKNGEPYLKFTVPSKQGDIEFIAKYVGKVRIKVRAGESTPIKRPIVLMNVKIGDITNTIKVNLTNRKRFNYPLLLGRDAIIAFSGLVDPSAAFLLKPAQETQK